MEVYRIVSKKWSKQLIASGRPARWNSKGIDVIYTAASRALACLENIVHRSGEGMNESFRILAIEIPSSLKIKEIDLEDLPPHWFEPSHYLECRDIGDHWIAENQTAVLKVPSAIIMNENNYLLNPRHIHFKKIKVRRVEQFAFDPRIKNDRIK